MLHSGWASLGGNRSISPIKELARGLTDGSRYNGEIFFLNKVTTTSCGLISRLKNCKLCNRTASIYPMAPYMPPNFRTSTGSLPDIVFYVNLSVVINVMNSYLVSPCVRLLFLFYVYSTFTFCTLHPVFVLKIFAAFLAKVLQKTSADSTKPKRINDGENIE